MEPARTAVVRNERKSWTVHAASLANTVRAIMAHKLASLRRRPVREPMPDYRPFPGLSPTLKDRQGQRTLGKCLCEVGAAQYWRLENLKSFDEFLERRFPESRRKAYYLMSIHEHLPPQVRKDLKQVGWTKGVELAKLARKPGQRFESATWMHKARRMPKEEFRKEVEGELTGREEEPSELIDFKLYKIQIPVIEQAIRDGSFDAGLGQVPRLLPGDDLRRLPGWGPHRRR